MDIDQFTQLLVHSRLFGEQESRDLAAEFQKACNDRGEDINVALFSEFLVKMGYVTRWQCDKLLVGKWKGFYLDNFLLLEQVGKGSDYSSYKARNARDGKLVCLVVTPTALAGGKIEYRIETYSGS